MTKFFSRGIVALGGALLCAASANAAGPYGYYPITPCRILDTQSGAALVSGPQYNYRVHLLCGIPTSARAVALNVTVIYPGAEGFVALYPYPGPFPGVSTVNVHAYEPALGNGAIVPIGTDANYQLSAVYGTCCGGASTHIVVDVTGYFRTP